MSVNPLRPHVWVLPEDDANRQFAVGFRTHHAIADSRIRVLPEAGGWRKVQTRLIDDEVPALEKAPSRILVLLVDFDERAERREQMLKDLPPRLADRVFVLGVWSEPEKLTASVGRSCEEISALMAADCVDEGQFIWGHPLLQHNASELARLREHVRPIIFPEA